MTQLRMTGNVPWVNIYSLRASRLLRLQVANRSSCTTKDLDGNEISSAKLRGKVVLVDFWATWCKPCEKEMPGYQKPVDRYGARGFAVIGLKLDTMTDSQDPRAFAKKRPVCWAHYGQVVLILTRVVRT